MPTCSFCKKHYKEPRGLTVFGFDGRAIHFCSSKCQRNLKLKRDPKKTNWVKREKKGKKKQLEAEKIAAIKEETGEEEVKLEKGDKEGAKSLAKEKKSEKKQEKKAEKE